MSFVVLVIALVFDSFTILYGFSSDCSVGCARFSLPFFLRCLSQILGCSLGILQGDLEDFDSVGRLCRSSSYFLVGYVRLIFINVRTGFSLRMMGTRDFLRILMRFFVYR